MPSQISGPVPGSTQPSTGLQSSVQPQPPAGSQKQLEGTQASSPVGLQTLPSAQSESASHSCSEGSGVPLHVSATSAH